MSIDRISQSAPVVITEGEPKKEPAEEPKGTSPTASSSASSFKLNEHGKCGWQRGGCPGASKPKVRKHPAE